MKSPQRSGNLAQIKNLEPYNRTRRQIVLTVIALLAVGLCIFWWRYVPPPSVGGGLPDSLLASWVKSRVYASVSALDEQGFTRLTPQNAAGWYGIFREPIQSLEYYQSRSPIRPTPVRRTLVLQPIGRMTDHEQALLSDLKDYCQAFFQLPVRIEKPLSLDLAKAWTRPRSASRLRGSARNGQDKDGREENRQDKQYNAGEIIDRVLAPRLPPDAVAYLGITMADLWADDLNYVFGLGSLEKRTGVYSLCRYYPSFWGHPNRPQDNKQALRRACQVLNHEAGHIFGLYHCVLYKCSMNGGNSLPDIDATPLDYCPVCHRKLLWNTGCEGGKRYGDLLRFYQQHEMTDEARWVETRMECWRQVTHEAV